MSRTDKDRPYKVRKEDPAEKQRYWAQAYGDPESRWYKAASWELHIYPACRPPKDVKRAVWKAQRARDRSWERTAAFFPDDEPPDARTRHSLLWRWV